MSIDFVMNEYDPVGGQYYTSFRSYMAASPTIVKPTGTVGSSSGSPIYGVLAVAGGVVATQVSSTPERDVPRFGDYRMTMQVAATVASAWYRPRPRTR